MLNSILGIEVQICEFVDRPVISSVSGKPVIFVGSEEQARNLPKEMQRLTEQTEKNARVLLSKGIRSEEL